MAWLTYRCLREKCGVLFETQNVKARCPTCRTRRLQWVPIRIAVRAVASGVDRDLRQAASAYGLTDLHSARAGETTMPQRRAPAGAKLAPYKAGDGWNGAVWQDQSGAIMNQSLCAPAGMTSKVVVEAGRRATVSGPGPESMTSYHARHTPKQV